MLILVISIIQILEFREFMARINDSYNLYAYGNDTGDKAILDRIYKNVNRYFRFNQHNINRCRIDRRFLFYDQWTLFERQAFQALNKPIFTYNKLYDYYRKLIGEQRFNTTNLEVSSLNGTASEEDITLRADIIRGIEYRSKADIAYQNAFANAVSGGMGFIRVRTDYRSPKSFEQEIFIEAEKYSDRVGWDPNALCPTKTDGLFMFRYDTLNRDDFEEKYPEIPYPQSFPASYNTEYFNWGDIKGITICEYYEKQYYNFTLYQLSNGEEITKKEYNKRKKALETPEEQAQEQNQEESQGITSGAQIGQADEMQQMVANMPPPMPPQTSQPPMPGQQPGMAPPQPGIPPQMPPSGTPEMPVATPPMSPPMMAGVEVMPTIVNKRRSRDYKIICYKAIAGHIIETYEWPSKHFPFAAVMGDEVVIEGQTIVTSLVTYAKDPQRFLNFLASDTAQAAKNNRREQFLATPSNIEGYDLIWKNPANQAGVLLYNPDDKTQQPPVRLPVPELPQTLLLNMQQADKDLRSIIGYPQEMNDGRAFGQLSGKAIEAQQRIGNSSNLVFFDNLKIAQEQIGRVILSMLPKVYDTQRILSVHGVDGKSKQITVNKKIAGGMSNDLSKGEFDVTIKAGANYAAQKEDALKILMELAQAGGPQMFSLIADIVAKNIDIEDNIELVNRLKTLVPPDVLAKSEGKPPPPPPPPPPPNPQQQLEQAKLQLSAAKVQGAQEQVQAQRELNAVKMNQANIDAESAKVRAYAELQHAGLDYKAAMVESAAKIAAAHSSIADKHFETIKHIHNLHSEGELSEQAQSNQKQQQP